MPNRYQLQGKIALVTGAGSSRDTKEFGRIEGIGSGITRVLAENGCDVLFTFNTSIEGAQSLQNELEKACPGRRIVPYQYCAEEYAEQAPSLMERIRQDVDRVDILVNNIGRTLFTASGVIHEERPEDVEKSMRINFFSAYELSKRILEQMVRDGEGGHLVNINSCSLTMPHAKRSGYGATKHAMHGMLREFTSYYGQFGIKILELQLGVFETLMTLPRLAFYREACKKGAVPLPRLGRPEEVGQLVAFFASGACDYLHGAEVRLDGGLTIRSFDTLTLAE